MRKLLIIIALGLQLAGCGSGSDLSGDEISINAGSYSFTSALETINASIDKFVAVNVEVNGVSGLFIIDSGADAFIVSPEFAGRAGLEVVGHSEVTTVAGTSDADVRRITSFRIANVQGSDIDALEVGLGGFDGAIGVPLLDRTVVLIDYLNQRVSFADPAKFRLQVRANDSQSILTSMNDYEIDAVSVNGQTIGKLRIDTGNSGGVHISRDHAGDLLETAEKTAETSFTTTNGSLSGTSFIADQLEVESIDFQNQFVVVQEPTIDAGLLGNLVLKQMTLGLDGSRNELLLQHERDISYSLSRLNLLVMRGFRTRTHN